MSHVLLATRNAGKLREVREIAAGTGWIWHTLAEFAGLSDVDESGATFAENARLKALHYGRLTGLPTLADDSGLEVDVLGGAPGVHSARFAGTPRDDAANNRKLLGLLAGVSLERRKARFRCAMALACSSARLCLAEVAEQNLAKQSFALLQESGEPKVVIESSGTFKGLICDEARGTNGFGYDPHFLVPELGLTAAELPSFEKNARSHRGQALRAMLKQMETLCQKGT